MLAATAQGVTDSKEVKTDAVVGVDAEPRCKDSAIRTICCGLCSCDGVEVLVVFLQVASIFLLAGGSFLMCGRGLISVARSSLFGGALAVIYVGMCVCGREGRTWWV